MLKFEVRALLALFRPLYLTISYCEAGDTILTPLQNISLYPAFVSMRT